MKNDLSPYERFQQKHYGNILPERKSLRNEDEENEEAERFTDFIYHQEPILIELENE